MEDKLFPAFQKYYSALKCLEYFDKENNFFDNISALDTFLLEYRNVTFVMQKSLAHTEYFQLYEKNKEKYLLSCKWFVDKRNEVSKERPFQLVKRIKVSVYFPQMGMDVLSQSFLVEDDVPLADLENSLREFLSRINPIEIFFSAKFSFFEKGTQNDIFDQIMYGTQLMTKFLEAMYEDVGEKSPLCEDLLNKILHAKVLLIPKDMRSVIDYVYYPKENRFERGEQFTMHLGLGNVDRPMHMKLEDFCNRLSFSSANDDYFKAFILLHVVMGSTDIMPVFMPVYEDGTIEIFPFDGTLKTTFYRKINDMAQQIRDGGIKAVCLMISYTTVDFTEKNMKMTSQERRRLSVGDVLAFMEVTDALTVRECCFDGKKLNDYSYIANRIAYHISDTLEIGKANMQPILKAFAQIKQRRDTTKTE